MTEARHDVKITKTDSDFISSVRITMIFALVIHHMFAIPNSGFYPRHSLDASFLNIPNFLNAVLHWTAMSAVPLLSIVSGFLYFNRPKIQHRTLLLKRFYSVLLPSLAWTTLWFIAAYGLVTVGRTHGQFQWLDHGFATFNWLTLLNGIIGFTDYPIAFQFWFIHDLILTLLLAPLLGWLILRGGLIFILALTLVWLINKVPPPFFSLNVFYFFTLGSFLAIRSISLEHVLLALKRYQWLVLGLFLAVLISRVFSSLNALFGTDTWLCFLRVTGVSAVSIVIYSLILRQSVSLNKISAYSPYSFFIFASHYPIIEFFKIVAQRLPFQTTMLGQLLTLIVVPIAAVMTCMLGAMIIHRFLPRIFAFLNGGRVL